MKNSTDVNALGIEMLKKLPNATSIVLMVSDGTRVSNLIVGDGKELTSMVAQSVTRKPDVRDCLEAACTLSRLFGPDSSEAN